MPAAFTTASIVNHVLAGTVTVVLLSSLVFTPPALDVMRQKPPLNALLQVSPNRSPAPVMTERKPTSRLKGLVASLRVGSLKCQRPRISPPPRTICGGAMCRRQKAVPPVDVRRVTMPGWQASFVVSSAVPPVLLKAMGQVLPVGRL